MLIEMRTVNIMLEKEIKLYNTPDPFKILTVNGIMLKPLSGSQGIADTGLIVKQVSISGRPGYIKQVCSFEPYLFHLFSKSIENSCTIHCVAINSHGVIYSIGNGFISSEVILNENEALVHIEGRVQVS